MVLFFLSLMHFHWIPGIMLKMQCKRTKVSPDYPMASSKKENYDGLMRDFADLRQHFRLVREACPSTTGLLLTLMYLSIWVLLHCQISNSRTVTACWNHQNLTVHSSCSWLGFLFSYSVQLKNKKISPG